MAGNITGDWMVNFSDIESKFALRSTEEPEDDLCYIVPGQRETIKECHFNTDTKTFIVIHGWTVSANVDTCYRSSEYKLLFKRSIRVQYMHDKL